MSLYQQDLRLISVTKHLLEENNSCENPKKSCEMFVYVFDQPFYYTNEDTENTKVKENNMALETKERDTVTKNYEIKDQNATRPFTGSNFWPLKKTLTYLKKSENLKKGVRCFLKTDDYDTLKTEKVNEILTSFIDILFENNVIKERIVPRYVEYLNLEKKIHSQCLLLEKDQKTYVIGLEGEVFPKDFLSNLIK